MIKIIQTNNKKIRILTHNKDFKLMYTLIG